MMSLLSLLVCLAPLNSIAPAPNTQKTTEYPGLSNVLLISDGLINGACPEGDAGLDSLRGLGVRTILCVDGSPPHVDGARARGMRYVHIPIGYDEIARDEALQLMRVATDLEKPIYIHCSHGRHRSPAAGAIVGVGLGFLTVDEAKERLATAGTSPAYAGLHASVSNMRPVGATVLAAVVPRFPERAVCSDLVGGMVRLGQHWDRLELIRSAAWRTPARHPDLVPANESTRLESILNEISETAGIQDRPPAFQSILSTARQQAQQLIQSIRQHRDTDAEVAYQALRRSCTACHQQFRN